MNATALHGRKPTNDEACGMAWWNALTRRERSAWLQRAGSACPADAWGAYKNSVAPAIDAESDAS